MKAGRPIPSSLSHLPKHENKKTGHGTYNPNENNFVFGLSPWNTNIITIAVPKRREDGTECNLRR